MSKKNTIVTILLEISPGHHVLKDIDTRWHNVITRKFKCEYCGEQNKYLDIKENPLWCRHCHNSGRKLQEGAPMVKSIQSWRLNVDDIALTDILKGSPEDFGMPSMSNEKWGEFYDQETEKNKQREFSKAKQNLVKETFASIDSQNN